MTRTGIQAVLVTVGLAAVTAVSRAQPAAPADAQVAEAERLFNEGVAATERGDFEDALRSFEASYRLNVVPEVLFNIGMCRKALGDPAAAANAFRDFVAVVGDGVTQDERADLDALLVELVPQIGRITIESTGIGARISVDGVPAATTPLATWIAVEPGRHVVAVTGDGFEPFSAEIEIEAGQTLPVAAFLVAAAGSQHPPAEEVAAAPAAAEGGLGPWFWASVGIAGAAAAGMAITGGLTLKYNDDFDAGGRRDEDLHDTTLALRTTTDVLLGVAVAAVVAGTVLFFVGDDGEEPEDRSSQVSVGFLPVGLVMEW